MFQQTAKELIQFIEKSPTCFQAVATMKEILEQEGYSELREKDKWNIEKGGRYFVTRNDSSLIAFTVPKEGLKGFRIMASHSDSPTFKIKDNPEMTVENKYVKLNVERYGGMLCAPWFDRPLSIAGRVVVKEKDEFVTKLVDVDRDLVMIPNLAIHMNRQANEGYQYSAQKDMLPLYGEIAAKDTFMETIAQAAGVKAEDILGHDLFLYNRQKGCIWGAQEEFLSIGRLDDLQCAFASLKGFLGGEKKEYAAVHCVLDNEEVGSSTKQGAASTFLYDVLVRMVRGLGMDYEDYLRALADSFMISADNGHALHPNHAEKSDPVNRPVLNQGIVIKYSGNQKYCTDAVSAAMFKDLCSQAEVPYQTFTNNSDIPGGSTLGNISNTKVALNSVDIGLPQLAMHSPYETVGVKDTYYLIEAAKKLFA
nr:M18 family aminopeptidase [uncultured Blautia sp.]